MSKRELYRSSSDKKLLGVCGGIADYFGISSTLVRVIWAFAVLIFGTGLLLYIVAGLIMPAAPRW